MKHSLQLKLGQHLTLTPQLQQSIRLLQLSTLELNQELEQMLQDNPLLEREEEDEASPAATETPAHTAEAEIQDTDTAPPEPGEPEPSATLDDADWNDYSVASSDDEDNDYTQGSISGATLREHLLNQLIVSPLTLRDRTLVAALIDDLDDSGFLTQPLEDITASLQGELEELEPEELDIALKHLQNMDPTGVGARNLAECLTLQLRALPPDTPARDAAMRLTTHYLDLLAARDVGKLKKMLGIDDAMLRAARALILSLNPRPGAAFGADDTIPDVYVRKVKGMWIASLNADAMPKLRVNRVYADILSRHRESGGNQLASQLQEARWLIKNVQQRFDTILRVSQAIVDRQKQFFEHGEVAMRPLVLREIADAVELHESTISRVTTQKYMMTPRGLYELKYFFGSHVSTDSGGACSSTAIRALIKQLVAAESTKKPLSDGQLAGVLGQQGIVVARRTVAKYRESLQIPPANMRRAL